MKVVLFVLVQLLFVVTFAAKAQQVHEARPHYVIHSAGHAHPDDVTSTSNQHGTRAASLKALSPTALKAAYGLPNSNSLGAGQTVAVIDVGGASTVEADLAVFSNKYGLPPATAANGMFKKVDQNGGTNYPANNAGWAIETALDVQAVHAMAPSAKILLVVCNTASSNDLFVGVDTARKAGATYISMSFSFVQPSGSSYYDSHFNTTAPISYYFASTGDSGSAGGIAYPAASPFVIAVGGTSVYTNTDSSFSSETGWSGSGGGCSLYTPVLSAQAALSGYSVLGCNNKKSLPDLSMVGDPNSGLLVYNTAPTTSGTCTPPTCWYQVGGTSLSSPLAAARAAIRAVPMPVKYVYTGSIVFRDITSGNNGAYQCTAGIDKVTGRGTWVGST